jgi:hypothetical protein
MLIKLINFENKFNVLWKYFKILTRCCEPFGT